jgi:hypothetical protein
MIRARSDRMTEPHNATAPAEGQRPVYFDELAELFAVFAGDTNAP